LPPFPFRPSPISGFRLKLRSKCEEVLFHTRESIDVNSLSGKDHPQARPFRGPAANVLSPEVLLEDFRTLRVFSDQSIPCRRVNKKSFVQTGLHSVQRLHTSEFPKLYSSATELLQ